jgi:hypothetical protein
MTTVVTVIALGMIVMVIVFVEVNKGCSSGDSCCSRCCSSRSSKDNSGDSNSDSDANNMADSGITATAVVHTFSSALTLRLVSVMRMRWTGASDVRSVPFLRTDMVFLRRRSGVLKKCLDKSRSKNRHRVPALAANGGVGQISRRHWRYWAILTREGMGEKQNGLTKIKLEVVSFSDANTKEYKGNSYSHDLKDVFHGVENRRGSGYMKLFSFRRCYAPLCLTPGWASGGCTDSFVECSHPQFDEQFRSICTRPCVQHIHIHSSHQNALRFQAGHARGQRPQRARQRAPRLPCS